MNSLFTICHLQSSYLLQKKLQNLIWWWKAQPKANDMEKDWRKNKRPRMFVLPKVCTRVFHLKKWLSEINFTFESMRLILKTNSLHIMHESLKVFFLFVSFFSFFFLQIKIGYLNDVKAKKVVCLLVCLIDLKSYKFKRTVVCVACIGSIMSDICVFQYILGTFTSRFFR